MIWAVLTKDMVLFCRDPVWRFVLVGYLVVFTVFSWLSYSNLIVLQGGARTPAKFL